MFSFITKLMLTDVFVELEQEDSISARWTEILKYLDNAGYRKSSDTRVLEAACGELGASRAEVDYFGRDSTIIGVDSDPHQLFIAARNTRRYPNISLLPPQSINQMDQRYDGYFDVVIARQPRVENFDDEWEANFKRIEKMLKDGGYLLATFRMESEMSVAMGILGTFRLVVKDSGRNRHSIFISQRDSMEERLVRTDLDYLVAQKQPVTLSSPKPFPPQQIS